MHQPVDPEDQNEVLAQRLLAALHEGVINFILGLDQDSQRVILQRTFNRFREETEQLQVLLVMYGDAMTDLVSRIVAATDDFESTRDANFVRYILGKWQEEWVDKKTGKFSKMFNQLTNPSPDEPQGMDGSGPLQSP